MERRVQERTSALAAAKLEAEATNRMKDEFLATLSHELRTPLNAILGWTHVLESGKRDEALIARATRVIRNSAEAQAKLVTHILDVSRIIGGKLALLLSTADLRLIIGDTLDTLQPAILLKSITVQTRFEGGATLVADPDRLQQVMWNILSNAIKFTPKGGRVCVEVVSSAQDMRVTVSDNGAGIDPAFLPRVFERFSQADASQSRAHSGLGLGMAIVRHLVELHGGSVAVDSAGKDQGTTVSIVLPLRAQPVRTGDAGEPERQEVRPAQPRPLACLDGVSVLIVDDEEDAREVLTLILQDRGAVVSAVDSASAALDHLSRQLPDVLVSDIGMPGEDGHAFLRQLRARDADHGGRVPAIALTAYATKVDAVKARAAGFDRHVSKPVAPAEIIDAVAAMAPRR
jgi:CheY-like chemotaxis protein